MHYKILQYNFNVNLESLCYTLHKLPVSLDKDIRIDDEEKLQITHQSVISSKLHAKSREGF